MALVALPPLTCGLPSQMTTNLTETGPIYRPQTPPAVSRPAKQESIDIPGALWRYRWAMMIPAILGGLLGFIVFTTTEETYRSTTKLMVESDNPVVLDSLSGERFGGVPTVEIVEAQLFSDAVVARAFHSTDMEPYRYDENTNPEGEYKSFKDFNETVRDQMKLVPEVDSTTSVQATVMLLHFDHPDREQCKAAVTAFSDALQSFYNEKHKGSREELMRMIRVAQDQLIPQMEKAEDDYAKFRSDAPLFWGPDGVAINPHRERQLFLVKNKSVIVEELRAKMIALAQLKSVAEKSNDPMIALNIMSTLLGTSIDIPNDARKPTPDARIGDAEIANLELDQKLFSLIVERDSYAQELGANHPTVKTLDKELELRRTTFRKLVKDHADRIKELAEKNAGEYQDPAIRAQKIVEAVLTATKAEVQLLTTQITQKDEQIAEEKAEAIKISWYEQENDSLRRDIEIKRGFMTKLQENMARVKLTEEESGTLVTSLAAPSDAGLVSPIIWKNMGIGIFMGLLLGGGLAVLLEKNANTFRDPEEIADVLGAPILTHVPFFRGIPKKRRKKGELDPYKDLDSHLCVIHQPSSIAAEAIRSFRTQVFFETAGQGGKIIQITSPLPGDGKSTIASNLACSIAQSGKRVLAIDCDLRRPQLTDNFAMSTKSGLTAVLNGDDEIHEAIHQSPIPNLSIMPSGSIPANPAEALTLPEMRQLLDVLRDKFDYIILDTPPLLVVTDPSITASMVDGVVLTVRVRRKSKPNAKESMGILRAVGAHVLGVVINNSDEAGSSDGYRGYGYYKYARHTTRYYRGGPGGNGRTNATDSSPVIVSGRGGSIGDSGKSMELLTGSGRTPNENI